ncbi:hypothetical protein SCHPADRAFT_1001605 [Schizopora paradoxa]|uniref:Uncharacterized protein n=1 Tax=Schizopora paradoxa TaxID=27342 RepID=A0A0H2RRT9_9AGAM|nr:hypothetical protein SCHPADRAFT_1001605 [Schizopora paradoxa]
MVVKIAIQRSLERYFDLTIIFAHAIGAYQTNSKTTVSPHKPLPPLSVILLRASLFMLGDNESTYVWPSESVFQQSELERVESNSSISTNATAPNLPGPGRNVGRLTRYLGNHLERVINSSAKRLRSFKGTIFNPELTSAYDLQRTYTNSSVSTNATASNLPGAGRTVGLVLDWLGGRLDDLMNISAHRHGLGPRAVTQEIRRLLLHSETTIVERHSGFVYDLTSKQEHILKKRCKRLLQYARHRIASTQFRALEEIINLTIEDPLVRFVFAELNIDRYLDAKFEESNLILASSRAIGSIRAAQVHDLWSGVLLGRFSVLYSLSELSGKVPLRSITSSDFDVTALRYLHGQKINDFDRFLRSLHEDPLFSFLRQLKTSLGDSELSFLAARYLNVLRTQLSANTNADPPLLNVVEQFCSYYFNEAVKSPSVAEWSNLDKLYSGGSSLSAGSEGRVTLAKLATHLINEAQELQGTLSRYFTMAKLAPRSQASEFSGPEEDPLRPRHCGLAITCVSFFGTLTKSRLLRNHISYIRKMDSRTRRLLKGTVLINEMAVAYCHINLAAYSFFENTWNDHEALENLRYAGECLASYLDSEYDEDRKQAEYLSALCFRVHRYGKLAIVNGASRINIDERSLNGVLLLAKTELGGPAGYSDFFNFRGDYGDLSLTRVRVAGDAPKLIYGGIISQERRSRNDRYRLGGFVLEALRNVDNHATHRVFVDTMLITKSTVMITCVNADETFDATGHYPLLAGYNSNDEALFVALKDPLEPRVFTCIKDGASYAEFRKRSGETEIARAFYVLVLRYDPVDFEPEKNSKRGIGVAPEGAMDPTGPVFWINLWPRSDASFPISNFVEDLRYLGSIEKHLGLRSHLKSSLEGASAESTMPRDLAVKSHHAKCCSPL